MRDDVEKPSETNGQCFTRISDKYRGVKFCEMTTEELDELLGSVARRGAADALKAVGLDDENAVADIRDIRDMLKGFRVIKKTAWTTVWASLGRVVGWVLILSMAGLFLHNESAKRLIDKIVP